jgi:hypothetical protein
MRTARRGATPGTPHCVEKDTYLDFERLSDLDLDLLRLRLFELLFERLRLLLLLRLLDLLAAAAAAAAFFLAAEVARFASLPGTS